MEQDKKKVQSMAEIMKNPTKIVLLQVCKYMCACEEECVVISLYVIAYSEVVARMFTLQQLNLHFPQSQLALT